MMAHAQSIRGCGIEKLSKPEGIAVNVDGGAQDGANARVLTRTEAAKVLTESGFPTSPDTLASLASRGGGPPFRKYGRLPLYTTKDLLDWAETRMGPKMRSNHVPMESRGTDR